MSTGATRAQSTPDGTLVRIDNREDGRWARRKDRDIVWFVRFDDEWFDRLQSMLDLAKNRAAHTAVAGCHSRAELVEKVFTIFLRIDELARELGYRETDELVTHMITGYLFLVRRGSAPDWLSIEQSQGLPIAATMTPTATGA